ncbi:MAG TPA: MG2 domain-containing protein [Chitinophagaceae bacterium]|nr:MG2 domain-containing protein [Chitinophagaceae bacterium]
MRIAKFSLIPVCIGIIFLYACNRQAVALDYTNAKEEVPQLGNLVFRFSKPLVADSLLNQWDSTDYISFEPRIPGRFRWEHTDELVFSPARPLSPATTYKASINKELLRYSAFDKVEKADELHFSTPDLQLENTNITWVLQDVNGKLAVPQADLYFNYPVEPAVLKDKLVVTVDGKTANYSVQTVSGDNKISIRLPGIAAEDRDLDVKISLDKGLLPQGGSNPTKSKAETSAIIPSPFTLTINDANAEHDGTTGTITVRTSQQLTTQNLASFVRFEPAVIFTTAVTDDGFTISSDAFDASKSYVLTLVKGIRGTVGGVLKEDYKNNFAFGKLEPAVSFVNRQAVYLAGQGNKNIEVKLVNVAKVKVIISKIYESNLLAAQRNGYYPKESSGEGEEYYENESDAVAGDIIYEKEVDTKTLPKSGSARLFNFNFEDKLPDFKGIYHIKIKSTEDYWVSDSRFISLSDFGLIAKEGSDKIVVFVNSLKTAAPVNGVNVLAYGGNNQLLGSGSTNAEGVAEIQYSKPAFAGFRPAMIIAKSATDFNYLPFNSTRVNMSRFEVGGKHINSTGLDAFIYAERDIYRPGEKVNFSVLLRDRQWKSPGELPVKLKFLLPNGKELKSFRKNLNEQGSLEGSVDIAASAITGSYSLEVYNGNDVLLGSQNFMIEEFVPDRIKVSAKLNKESLVTGETAALNINALNFFGPPAANRNYECEIQVKQVSFHPAKYPNYNFSIDNPGVAFDKTVREGKTDENGNATESFVAKTEYKNAGVLQANFYATVFDETGRPVSRRASADIYTQPVFFGIGEDGWWYYPLNKAIKFPLLALNKTEQLVGAQARAEVIKHEYRTVLTKNGEYFRYESQKEDKLVASNDITVTGENTSYTFIPRSAGNYELRIYIPGASSYVKKDFYSYGGWGNDNNSFEVSTEGNIDIDVDKQAYNAGDNATILFKTPFSGKMLVTLETDKVLSYQFLNVDGRQASMNIKLTGEHLPNVYITATLIKPHDVSDIPLTVAHGYRNIMVEEKDRKMNVQVIAPATVRSRTHQKVTVKAAANSYVTLAAVDNGVLQVSNFQDPDPYHYFYGKRSLDVTGYDMYPLLFPEIRARMSSTGGDGDLETSKRSNPMPNKRVKIVSYWSGIVKADGSGEAKFEFDIPAFSGEIRLMAVAYKDQRFGNATQAMKVADPLVLSTALPRFLSPGDTVTVPVTITNTTAKSGTAEAVATATAPLQVAGAAAQSVVLKPNSEAQAIFKIVASPAISTGKIKIAVKGMGELFTDETDITVRPPSTLQKITGSGTITGTATQRITIGQNDFIPGSASYKLVVSRSPALQLANQFAYLVAYPYGCTEQVVSAAFPQLYYGDLADLFNSGKAGKGSANSNIQEAIRKIQLRQLYNGGITLWDGEGKEHWWTSAYAAHFLLEAQKAGYAVDKSLLQTLLSYLNNKLRTRETIVYYYNQKEQKKIAPKELAYSLYVLALANRANVSVMNYYKANPALLALDSRYLLSATYAVAGDKTRFRELLPGSFSGEVSVAQTGGSFYSDIRDESIALNTLIDVDPGNAQIPVMAGHIVEKLKQRSWYSTQESAFSFLAMGKLARAANAATVTAKISVNGKTVATLGSANLQLSNKELNSNVVDISTSGQGSLYYWWQSEGISANGSYREEDSYLKVRRKFFDRYGRVITGNSFKQNDLVIVQLSLESAYSGAVENIVLTDLLPAGFEIENPRTKELPGMEWIKDASTPTALDVRDDRINFFVDLYSARQYYYYAVRAVSPGIYKMGPASADAMYNAEYHSYNGGGTIKVLQ